MFGIGIFELLIIFVVILVCVGPDKLPDFARTMASYLGEFRRASDDLKRTVMSATEDIDFRVEPSKLIGRISQVDEKATSETLKGNPAAPKVKNGPEHG